LRSALVIAGGLVLLAVALYFSHDALAQQTMNGGGAINGSGNVGTGQWQHNNSGSGDAFGTLH
jgi:hypothetical protein